MRWVWCSNSGLQDLSSYRYHPNLPICLAYKTSTVSNDAPEYFHSSKRLSINSDAVTLSNRNSLMATQISLRKNAVKMEASYLLPGGDSIRAATQNSQRHKFKALPMKNKVLLYNH